MAPPESEPLLSGTMFKRRYWQYICFHSEHNSLSMLTNLTANASRVTSRSGGGESADIYAPLFDNTPVIDFTHGSLPCRSPSRTVHYRLAAHHLSSGLAKCVIVFPAPLTRTHCPPPPYCPSSPARSSYHTYIATVYDSHPRR